MKTFLFLPVLLILMAFSMQKKPAYSVFTSDGKNADYGDIIKSAVKSDVVFFGELHDNPIAHWLELEVTKSLFAEKGNNMILAAEMFETDNQLLIDEYFSGLIKESSFESEARLWNNYKTDYKPLVNFAKENGINLIASNIPRRYASMVASGGFEALQKVSNEGTGYIAPLPILYDPELPCYKDMLSMEGGPKGHAAENLPKAQAIKDATMANSLVRFRKNGQLAIHFNGSYHSDRYMGIIWYLNKYQPGLSMTTIKTVMQDDITSLGKESLGQADFIIVIPNSMTRTYF